MLSPSFPLPLFALLPRFALSFSSSRLPSPSLFLPHPLVVVALSGPGTPFDAPEGPLPLFRPTVPPRNFFAAGCLAAASLSRDSLPTSTCLKLASNHYNRPSITTLPYILHIINYQSRSWTTNLAHPPSCRPRQPFRAPFRVSSVTHKIGEFIKQEIDISSNLRMTYIFDVSKEINGNFLIRVSVVKKRDQRERESRNHLRVSDGIEV